MPLSLDTSILKVKNPNGDGYIGVGVLRDIINSEEINKVVRYDITQSLTDTEKSRARANIGISDSYSQSVQYVSQNLTTAQKNIARVNIAAVGYEAQGLTAAQQTQARANIAALGTSELDSAISDVEQDITDSTGNITHINSGASADKAYIVGDTFIYENTLYVATQAIALNERIIPNTNCIASDVVNEIVKAVTKQKACKAFKKVICLGDSMTSGYIKLSSDASPVVNEFNSWPYFMSTITGEDWICAGVNGVNVQTYQSNAAGLAKVQSLGRAQAYVIDPMVYDSQSGLSLGSTSDIGKTTSTFYAQLSALIRAVNAINSAAKIFVNTAPSDTYASYNTAIRDIVNSYKSTYPVYCIDLYAYKDLYESTLLKSDLVNGHYTEVGYEQMAELYTYILSKYMNDNLSSFQNIHNIPVDNL